MSIKYNASHNILFLDIQAMGSIYLKAFPQYIQMHTTLFVPIGIYNALKTDFVA